MPWTTPETFTAGQTLTAASMNAIQSNLSFIPRGVVATAVATGTQPQGGITTTITDLNGLTLTATFTSGRYYLVSFTMQGAYSTANGDWARILLNVGGSSVQDTYFQVGNTEVTSITNFFLTTSLSGSTTIKLQAVRTVGSGNIAFDSGRTGGSRLLVTDLGSTT